MKSFVIALLNGKVCMYAICMQTRAERGPLGTINSVVIR